MRKFHSIILLYLSLFILGFITPIVPELTISLFVTFIVTKYFDVSTLQRNSIGALTLVSAEIKMNTHLLTLIYESLLSEFEKTYNRTPGNNPIIAPDDFDEFAKTLKQQTNYILSSAFESTYVGLGNIQNHVLLEHIINLYNGSYHNRIQGGLELQAMSWQMLDSIKNAFTEVLQTSKNIITEIDSEIENLKGENIFVSIFKVK